MENYIPVITKVFKEYGIPFFADTRAPLASESMTKQLFNYIRVMIGSYSCSEVIEYSKNYFAGISDASAFENYCVKYSIDYTRFLSPFKLGDPAELSVAEAARSALAKQLLPLPAHAKVSEYVDMLYSFLLHNDYDTRLKNFANAQKEAGYTEGEARSAQVPVQLKSLLDQLRELMGEESKSLEQFYELLRAGVESVGIALIPQSADCVYVGGTEDSRYDDKRILFIIGAEDGIIPFETEDGGILGEREYAALKSADIVIAPTAKERNIYSKFYVEQLLIKPSEQLYVGYSALDARGARKNPSVIIKQLAYMFDIKKIGNAKRERARAYTYENMYKNLLLTIREYRRGTSRWEEQVSYADTVYSILPQTQKNALDSALGETEESIDSGEGLFFVNKYTSISQLECYFCCPYRHFVRYGLQAKEKEQGEIQARETGTVIHDMLEEYFKNTRRFDISDGEVAGRVNTIVDRLFERPRFVAMLESVNSVRLERLRKECVILAQELTALMRNCDFVPYQFEVRFGGREGADYKGINLLDGRIELMGKIDRIDSFRDEVAVIDYKTGKEESNLKNTYYGKKIQLYAYLAALRQAGKRPAAALYLPLKAEFSKEEKKLSRYSYCGQLVNDDRIILALDRTIMDSGSSKIIPVIYKEGKGFCSSSKNVLLSREDMDNIINYVIRLSETAAREILDGNITPNPAKDECKYCAVKAFCRFDRSRNRERDLPAVGLDRFEV